VKGTGGMVKRSLVLSGFVALIMLLPLSASEKKLDIDIEKDFSGYGGLLGGQIVRGSGEYTQIRHSWLETAYLGLQYDATMKERLRILLTGEMRLLFSYSTPQTEVGVEHRMDLFVEGYKAYLRNAFATYTFGNLAQYPLQITVGKIQYNWNPDFRNLGHYLFRTSSYPTCFFNEFDDTTAPLLGTILSTNFVKPLKLDLILSSETRIYPLQDWSLAGVGSIKIWKIAEFGAGCNFNRIFVKDKQYTTPTEGNVGNQNLYDFTMEIDTARDSLGNIIPDPFDPLKPLMDTTITNKKYYTFKSNDLFFRLSIDPKGLFSSWANIFGPNDLKIYSEIGFLGLKNYGKYYSALHNRMPIMLGFNIPTFRILDVLSFEIEFFDSPYIPGYDYAFSKGWPRPIDDKFPQNKTSVYYSFYAKKTLGGFRFVTQFARDHFKPYVNNINYSERNDVLVEKQDWWWALKVEYGF